MDQNTIGEIFLICPFSHKGLRLMGKEELATVNAKITAGELFFYPGVPVEIKLKKAYVTEHSTYIYPIFDNIICLKKETAIVPKNRTQNPLLRVSEGIVEAFYTHYRLRRKDKLKPLPEALPSTKISNDELNHLKRLLPNAGGVFISGCSNSIDTTHNIIFGLNYQQVVHFDHQIDRLKQLTKELNKDSLFVLGEKTKFPFNQNSIAAILSMDDISVYEKEDQKQVYEDLKRVLTHEGSSVMLYDKTKKLHAEGSMKSDKVITKAKGFFKPWNKQKVAEIHFQGVDVSNGQDSQTDESFMSKTSLGRQML